MESPHIILSILETRFPQVQFFKNDPLSPSETTVWGPFDPILATQISKWVISRLTMALTSKEKLLVAISRPQKYFWTLTLFFMGSFNPIMATQLSIRVLSRPSMALTSKANLLVDLNPIDLNLISHWSHLILFWPADFLYEYFLG